MSWVGRRQQIVDILGKVATSCLRERPPPFARRFVARASDHAPVRVSFPQPSKRISSLCLHLSTGSGALSLSVQSRVPTEFRELGSRSRIQTVSSRGNSHHVFAKFRYVPIPPFLFCTLHTRPYPPSAIFPSTWVFTRGNCSDTHFWRFGRWHFRADPFGNCSDTHFLAFRSGVLCRSFGNCSDVHFAFRGLPFRASVGNCSDLHFLRGGVRMDLSNDDKFYEGAIPA